MKTLVKNFILVLLIFLIISGIFTFFSQPFEKEKEISLSQLVEDINQEKIKKVSVYGSELSILYQDGTKTNSRKETESSLSESLSNLGAETAKLKKVEIETKTEESIWSWIGPFLTIILPLLLFGLFFWIIFRQAKAGAVQAFNFTKARARLFGAEGHPKEKITFKDVASLKEAKEELKEIVDFLKNPKKYLKMGARIPRGVLLLGPAGVGKCVVGNTFVLTSKGWIKIQDIPKYFRVNEKSQVAGAEVFSIDLKTLEKKKNLASRWYNLGKQKTIKITSQNGISLEGTPEHPIVIIDSDGEMKFKKLGGIKKGDLLVVNYNHQVFGNYKILPNRESAYLLGLLLGDGGLSIKNRIYFSSGDKKLIKFVKNYFQKYFGVILHKTRDKKYDWFISDWKVKEKLRKYGISESYAKGKEIPESIIFGPKEYQIEFIKGLFDTDGSVNPKGSVLQLCSASKTLISQLQVLLLNLGIVNKTRKKHSNQTGAYYHYLEISGDFIKNFAQEIGFGLKRKQEKLKEILKKKRNTNINVVPFATEKIKVLWEYLKKDKRKFNRAFYKTLIYKSINSYINEEHKNPSKQMVDRILEFFEKEKSSIRNLLEFKQLLKLADNNFFFSPVIEIEKGKDVVYDFTVPNSHSFVANGLINHNTLLARAVAGEANVPFFHISGSEFVEMFVGVGAGRVRDLFSTAKKASPSIIFIDELDAIGRQRGAGFGGGHDEREQTLNQILVEMDGFERETNVIILAATNRPDILDSALLRPGRFDRKVVLDMPDINGREEILKIHCQGKPLFSDVNLRETAERTPGFSGADVANVVNEAAILAARKNKNKIYQEEFLESIEKVLLGPERKSHILSKKEKEIAAFHEAGHALVSVFSPESEPVRKISIIARGMAAGYTLKMPAEERKIKTKKEFLAEMATLLGGYCAEKIKFKEITTGAANDLERASELARKLVKEYGMSPLGPISFGEKEELVFLGKEISEQRNYSEKVAAKIDKEVEKFIRNAEKEAAKILTKKKELLDKVAKTLIEKETIERQEFESLIKNGNEKLSLPERKNRPKSLKIKMKDVK